MIESGPLRGVVRTRRTHRATTIEQDLVVYAHTPRIDFVTQVDGPAVVETLKPAEDGRGIVVRLYEPHGARGPVTVRAPGISRVTGTNLVTCDINIRDAMARGACPYCLRVSEMENHLRAGFELLYPHSF